MTPARGFHGFQLIPEPNRFTLPQGGLVKKSRPRRDKPRLSSSPPRRPAMDGDGGPAHGSPFPIVGIGASAGGLEAFVQLLELLPSDTGMAFVLIQHLSTTQTSMLAEVLAKATPMRVTQAVEGEWVEPNHVYVNPPAADVRLLDGKLTLTPRDGTTPGPHLPIDFFFKSLAVERRSQAIGVILSGTASDGTEGLKAIKAEEGISLVQEPRSSRFGGMPSSAVDAGVVDYSLPIPGLAQEFIRLSRHPYVALRSPPAQSGHVDVLNRILLIVRNAVGVDFSEYKLPSFERRLARRMVLRRAEDLSEYLSIIQADPAEVNALYDDALIHVTSFFRDPEVFEGLKARVFPEILAAKAENDPIRIWVAGCSSGEEAYSLAITLFECLREADRSNRVQIFGSDVSESSIQKARRGWYPTSALVDVSDTRKKQFFTKVETGYRIDEAVRDACVFVRHDLARDPPFSKLDLVSCRNVLIYFDIALQKRVVPMFHYALNQPGFLLLGRTESVSGFASLFSARDKPSKVFVRSGSSSALRFIPRMENRSVPAVPNRPFSGLHPPRREWDLGKQLDRALASRYAPASALINDKLEILQFRGEIGLYLQPPPGEPQQNLLKMARGALVPALRTAIVKAKKERALVRTNGVDFQLNGSRTTCNIEVFPFVGSPPLEGPAPLFVVTFEAAKQVHSKSKTKSPPEASAKEARRVQQLEREVVATKEYLQSLLEEHGRTNDDLNSANEELISGNEELQSMNEELETAKEELQSTNEELSTVNDELHSRNNEVNQINSDLLNILSTFNLPILIVDLVGRIRRFTPMARSILNVVAADVGRPLADLRLNIDMPDLDTLVSQVIETNTAHEAEVQDRNGHWYRIQIRPYKTTDHKIDGATLSLVDIDSLKHHVSEAQAARADAERANSAKDQFLATLSHELRTPLSTMLIQAQLLRREGLDPKIVHIGERLERGTKMQVQLINDLLDVSRIAAGKLNVDVEPVDLCVVIRHAVEGVSPLAEKKSLRMTVVLDESIGMVSGDPVRLQQVISNLLVNAVKFTPDGGAVTVELDICEERARLRVQDTGMGIDPDFLPEVFNRFAQGDTSQTRMFGGLGLGLAIVRHLVEAHRGTVTAESPGLGKGATFSVTLPLISLHRPDPTPLLHSGPVTSARGGRSAADPARLKALRFLVVDDDPETRETVAELLQHSGSKVKVANSAAQAMALLNEFKPHVVVCDIAMPAEDGYSFIRRVRAMGSERSGDVPALALSALAGEEDGRRALEAGFQMYLKKPVDLERLTAALVELSQHPR